MQAPASDQKADILRQAMELCYRTGAIRAMLCLRKITLTVLCYHRVEDIGRTTIPGFLPNISASPDVFAQHMAFVRKYYSPVSLRDLTCWLDHRYPLPPNPILVTFDDGYQDNASVAWPIMRAHNIPVTIFLATHHVSTGSPFLWDFVAACFQRTALAETDLPLLGTQAFSDQIQRTRLVSIWMEAAKKMMPRHAWQQAHELAEVLRVNIAPYELPAIMNWTTVRDLAWEGVSFGGHTHHHPILSQIPPDAARREIWDSYDHLRSELGTQPLGFAYPNGSAADFSKTHEHFVRDTGFHIAFGLEPGLVPLSQLPETRYAVRRIYIDRKDDLPRFAAKLTGVGHLIRTVRNTFRPPIQA